MKSTGVRAGIAAIGILVWSCPLFAADPSNQRLNVAGDTLAPLSPEGDVAMAAIDAPLSQADRHLVDAARTRTFLSTLEPFDLAIRMSRFRSARPDATRFDVGSDRFTGQAASVILDLPLSSALTLQPDLTATRIRRHLVTIADIFRPRTTFATSIGLGLVSANGPTFRLDWVHSAPQGTRAPFERMAELMGGAPPAARGVRLSLLGNEAGGCGLLQWNFTLAAMQRARADSAFAAGPGYVPEKRAEIGLRLAF